MKYINTTYLIDSALFPPFTWAKCLLNVNERGNKKYNDFVVRKNPSLQCIIEALQTIKRSERTENDRLSLISYPTRNPSRKQRFNWDSLFKTTIDLNFNPNNSILPNEELILLINSSPKSNNSRK